MLEDSLGLPITEIGNAVDWSNGIDLIEITALTVLILMYANNIITFLAPIVARLISVNWLNDLIAEEGGIQKVAAWVGYGVTVIYVVYCLTQNGLTFQESLIEALKGFVAFFLSKINYDIALKPVGFKTPKV